MKIKIITIQYAHNYGAVLQAYSLKKTLTKMGHEVEIINYIPEKECTKYQKKLRNEEGIRNTLLHFKIVKWIKGLATSIFAQKEWNERYEKFEEFINKELVNGEKLVNYEDIKNIKADCFICGSDQIWNSNITGICNPVYYLEFAENTKRVAYAASMGKVKKPEADEKKKIINNLGKFTAISVREEPLKQMLEKECKINNIEVVVDPCMLLKKDDFNEIMQQEKLETKKYILNYFINENGLLKNNFKKIDKLNNLDIIEIHWKKQLFQKNKNQRNSLSINDFLWYIDNSELLYTDSFHGVIFSLIFHKNFYAIYDNNTRVQSILEKVGLENRHITSIENMRIEDITEEQWKKVDEKLDKLRNKSIEFLEKALN